jgi:hypothetical protein
MKLIRKLDAWMRDDDEQKHVGGADDWNEISDDFDAI